MKFKKFLSLVTLVTSIFMSYAQEYSYNELGILFAKDNNKGSARFNALSGAFGALGGDISSVTINPAGGAVAKISSINITGTNDALSYTTNYYNSSTEYEENRFRIPQIGALFVFSPAYKSDWNRSALYFNYRVKHNYNLFYETIGNSELLFYNQHESDPSATVFDRSLDQYLYNDVSGSSEVFDFGFSTVHKNKLFLGASVKLHTLQFSQEQFFSEANDDIDGNILETEDYSINFIDASGVSFSIGFIYKFSPAFRFGLAYETPTYYSEVIEEYYNEFIMYEINNTNLVIPEYFENTGDLRFLYQYKSPSRLTASGAFVFGKKGLISMDYTYKDYTNTEFSGGDFSVENNIYETEYRNTHALNIGTEWRFDNLSLRGGVSYEKDPNLIIGGGTNDDNIEGYSLGFGYNFGNTKIDFSYNNTENINYNAIYTSSDLAIDRRLSQISGTITFDL